MPRETVRFCGRLYARHTEASQESDRLYFKDHGRLLHRDVWEYHNGQIPEGHHIHHIDNDPSNNDPENLMLLSTGEHAKVHSGPASEAQKQHLEFIRPLAIEWHRSEAGRRWHSQHSIRIQANLKPKDMECQQCGNPYQSVKPQSKFCSNKCKAASRRASGVDDIGRQCLWCGAQFMVNKYAKTAFCSNQCAQRHRRA